MHPPRFLSVSTSFLASKSSLSSSLPDTARSAIGRTLLTSKSLHIRGLKTLRSRLPPPQQQPLRLNRSRNHSNSKPHRRRHRCLWSLVHPCLLRPSMMQWRLTALPLLHIPPRTPRRVRQPHRQQQQLLRIRTARMRRLQNQKSPFRLYCQQGPRRPPRLVRQTQLLPRCSQSTSRSQRL